MILIYVFKTTLVSSEYCYKKIQKHCTVMEIITLKVHFIILKPFITLIIINLRLKLYCWINHRLENAVASALN